MNSLSTKAVAAITLLALGFASGWMVKGWKVGNDEAKALEAQQKQFNANLEVKNANLEVVSAAFDDLSNVRVRLQTCKADLNSTSQEIARAGQLLEKSQAVLDGIAERIKRDALEADLFIEDLRARL